MTVQPILRWSSRTLRGRTLMSRRSAAKTFPQSGWKTAVFQSNCLSAGERQSPSADRRTGSAWCFYKNRPAGTFAGLFFTIKIHVSSKRCNQVKSATWPPLYTVTFRRFGREKGTCRETVKQTKLLGDFAGTENREALQLLCFRLLKQTKRTVYEIYFPKSDI